MTHTDLDCVWPVSAMLGEGPVWEQATQSVYFVDIKGHRLHRYQTADGSRKSWPTPGKPTFVLPTTSGDFVCGMDNQLVSFQPNAADPFRSWRPIEPADNGNRLNDGCVAADGSLWFGTMCDQESRPHGSLYQLTPSGQLHNRDTGYVITNGPVFATAHNLLYHTSTLDRVIYAFDVAPDGALHNKRVFLRTPEPGWPDGMAMDAEGHLWVAFFGGWRIDRYAPDGRLCASVPFPCANVTKLAFGGTDQQTVYATTARKGLSPQALEQQPLAGGLFAFRAPVAGTPQHQALPPFSF